MAHDLNDSANQSLVFSIFLKSISILLILLPLDNNSFFLIEDEEVPNLVGGDDQRDYDKPITRSNKKIYGDKKKEEVKVI